VSVRKQRECRHEAWLVTNSHTYSRACDHANDNQMSFGNALFGQVTGAYGERQMRFSARFMF